MKFYLACKFNDKAKVKAISSELERQGHQITAKWWEFEQKLPTERTFKESSTVGKLEIEGILESDVLICFLTDPEYPYKGTLCEFGVGVGSPNTITIIVTPKKSGPCNYLVHRVPHIYCADHWVYLDKSDWLTSIPEIMALLSK